MAVLEHLQSALSQQHCFHLKQTHDSRELIDPLTRKGDPALQVFETGDFPDFEHQGFYHESLCL
jgi:hypothetical protein